jgi:hypothetical protein
MYFKKLLNEGVIHHYLKFDIEVTAGPFPGNHFGYIPECRVYKGRIGENTNVRFIFNPKNNNYISFDNWDSFWYGEETKLQEQALDAIKHFDVKYFANPETLKTFEDLINDL